MQDMLQHIDIAATFIENFDYATFRDDLRTLYAVVRCLQIISEASRRIPDEVKARHPSIAWREMAAAGNVYRHEYEDVAARYVWDTVDRHLPPLRVALASELAQNEGVGAAISENRRK